MFGNTISLCRMKKTAAALAILAALLVLSACHKDEGGGKEGVNDEEPRPAAAPRETAAPGETGAGDINPPEIAASLPEVPARPGLDKDASFTLVYTTGISGEVLDCGCPGHPRGGLARRAKWVEGIKEARTVLQVDGGNVFFPSRGPRADITPKDKDQARVLAKGMARIGVDVVNLGGQDLLAGFDFLEKELAKPEGFDPLPLISANLYEKDTGERPFPPFIIKRIDGAQVGVFGVMKAERPDDPEVEVKDPLETTRLVVKALGPKCDLVIGLMGMRFVEASRIAKEVEGIDVAVVSDRTASPRHRPMVVGETLLVQAGNRGMYVGRMDITVAAREVEGLSKAEQIELTNRLARVEAQLKILQGPVSRDPDLRKEYMKYKRLDNEIRDKLAFGAVRFDHDNTVVSIEPDMPEDEEIASWVEEMGAGTGSAGGR